MEFDVGSDACFSCDVDEGVGDDSFPLFFFRERVIDDVSCTITKTWSTLSPWSPMSLLSCSHTILKSCNSAIMPSSMHVDTQSCAQAFLLSINPCMKTHHQQPREPCPHSAFVWAFYFPILLSSFHSSFHFLISVCDGRNKRKVNKFGQLIDASFRPISST